MSINPPTLADHFARLRATAQAQDAHAWSLHAVIAAILARIFGRLEQLFLLLQAGRLPPPETRRNSDRDIARLSGLPAGPCRLATRRAAGQPRIRDRHTCVDNPRVVRVMRAPAPAAGFAPSARTRLPTRQARAPPRVASKLSRRSASDRHAYLITF